MNLNDITADGFVNTDRLENTLIHIINEKKDSEKGSLSYIDTNLFVKKFMDKYESYFRRLIDDCYKAAYNDIFLGIASSLKAETDKEDQDAKQ